MGARWCAEVASRSDVAVRHHDGDRAGRPSSRRLKTVAAGQAQPRSAGHRTRRGSRGREIKKLHRDVKGDMIAQVARFPPTTIDRWRIIAEA